MSESEVKLIKEALTFLHEAKTRGEALETITGFTGTEVQRLFFKDTDACKLLIRVILMEPNN